VESWCQAGVGALFAGLDKRAMVPCQRQAEAVAVLQHEEKQGTRYRQSDKPWV